MFESWYGKSAQQRWAAGLLLGIVLFCVYYPVLHFDYLYHDDWIHFTDRGSPVGSAMGGWSQTTGRPLGGYVLWVLFRLFESVDEAWLARLVIVSAIAAFAFLQSIYFQALGASWITAVSLALGTSVLPGMLVFGYWITAGSLAFALLASAAAALATEAALRPEKGLAWRAMLLASACAFQIVSLLIYQTQAMYFWALTAAMLATRMSRDPRAAVRPLAVYTLVGGAPIAGYFIWFKYLSGFAPILAANDPLRGKMFSDPAATMKWFFNTALPRSAALWFLQLPRAFGLVGLVAFILFLVLFSAGLSGTARRRGDRTGSLLYAAYPFVIVALGCFSFSPMLVTNFRFEVFRSLVPLSALIFLSGALHLGILLQTERWPAPIRFCVAAGFVLGVSYLGVASLVTRMVLPAAAEYSFVRNSLLEAAQTGRSADRVHVIVPRVKLEPRTDEMDWLTVQFTQDIQRMIGAIHRELAVGPTPATFSLEGEPFPRDGAVVLDFVELSKSGLWRFASPFPAWITVSPASSADPRRPYAFVREVNVVVKGHGARDSVVRFTTDGSTPTPRSAVIERSIKLTKSTMVKAQAFVNETALGPVSQAEFERWDEDGALVTDIKRGGDPAEPFRAAVQPGSRVALWVNDANDGIDYDEADWADAAFECSSGRVYLSQLQPESARQEWGSLVTDRNLLHQPIQIHGHVYHSGLAVSANAELVYAVPQNCSGLIAWVGVDDAAEGKGSVRFIVRPIAPAGGAAANPQPRLLRAYGTYNLVSFWGLIYGVPWSLGPLGPVDWESGRVLRRPGVVTGNTVEEVLARLPK